MSTDPNLYCGAGSRDFNPRDELKKRSETYAQYIYYGLPGDKLQEHESMPEEEGEKIKAKFDKQ